MKTTTDISSRIKNLKQTCNEKKEEGKKVEDIEQKIDFIEELKNKGYKERIQGVADIIEEEIEEADSIELLDEKEIVNDIEPKYIAFPKSNLHKKQLTEQFIEELEQEQGFITKEQVLIMFKEVYKKEYNYKEFEKLPEFLNKYLDEENQDRQQIQEWREFRDQTLYKLR